MSVVLTFLYFCLSIYALFESALYVRDDTNPRNFFWYVNYLAMILSFGTLIMTGSRLYKAVPAAPDAPAAPVLDTAAAPVATPELEGDIDLAIAALDKNRFDIYRPLEEKITSILLEQNPYIFRYQQMLHKAWDKIK